MARDILAETEMPSCVSVLTCPMMSFTRARLAK